MQNKGMWVDRRGMRVWVEYLVSTSGQVMVKRILSKTGDELKMTGDIHKQIWEAENRGTK